ncbi:MAG: DUF2461 domain-containing protein [Salibacteraceae bacterium]|jgi:uncharacterized protein (TIGR02453 family)|nr:DUF2461 domain-containing protein [Salibacteraceae bacterium]MDP4687767.1 DUF2461 domain-containing protein [Salibacteraceae bacterium]MDP4934804.1 DUF2461 domain-containing protein [Salibacteraceae bacterium]MDP4963981.1 DUF2461 domain-containing protein [Salibacteraceae bacterium]
MAWFTPEYEAFFKELKLNNHRDWFHENKSRYETHVKKPFYQFVSDAIERMQLFDPKCQIEAKDAVFRINRDIRFSKEKTPYKTQMSAMVGAGGRKGGMADTGIYFEVGERHVRIYGGVYQPEKEQLQAIRQEILYNTKEFESIINGAAFKKWFGEIKGEKNKRLAPEFAEIQENQPLIANKQFYYFADLNPDMLYSDQLLDQFFEAFEASKEVRNFLYTPLND